MSVGVAYLFLPRFLWECLTSRTVSPFRIRPASLGNKK